MEPARRALRVAVAAASEARGQEWMRKAPVGVGSARRLAIPVREPRGQWRAFHGSTRVLSAQRDYYEVLGVSRQADAKELKAKFRQLAKKYHPDSNKDPDATSKFQEINHAYEVLSDPSKRQAYDNFGHDYEQAGMGGGGFGGGGGSPFSGFDFMFNGGRSRGGGAQEGADVQLQLNLNFMEAVQGCTKTVSFRADVSCGDCGGSGVKAGEAKSTATCSACNGQGGRMESLGGIFQVPVPCTVCNGSGETIVNKCPTCSGRGIETKIRSASLNIPAGVDSGMVLSQRGDGNAAPQGGRPGDLIVEINVARDSYFKRDGMNVHTMVPISLSQAVLGDKLGIRTLDGEVELKVPSGVANGEVRRLRNKGLPDVNMRSRKGDQFVTFKVCMPTSLTDRQREIMKEFDEIEKNKTAKSSS